MKRILAVAAELALLVVPIVVALAITGGRPWPTAQEITVIAQTGQVSADAMVRLSMLIGLVLWAWVAVILIRETVVSLRFEREGQPLPALSNGPAGVLKSLARFAAIGTLVGTVTLSSLGSSVSVPRAIWSEPISAVQPGAQSAATLREEAPAAPSTAAVVVADGRQTPLSYAVDLGDVTLRDTIIELNANNDNGWTGGVFPAGMDVHLPRPIVTKVEVHANVRTATEASTVNPEHQPAIRDVVVENHTVTVVKGDNLWNLTEDEFGSTDMGRIREIARQNDIPNPHLIYPGDVIDLGDDAGAPNRASESPSNLAPPAAPEPAQPAPAPPPPDDDPGRRNVGVDLDEGAAKSGLTQMAEPLGGVQPTPRTERSAPPTDDGVVTPKVAGAPASIETLLSFDRGLMLAAGVLAFLLARRRRQLRAGNRPAPSDRRMFEVERRLRSTAHAHQLREDAESGQHGAATPAAVPSPLERVERAAELATAHTKLQDGRMIAIVDSDDELTVRFNAPVQMSTPWRGDGTEWTIEVTDVDGLDPSQPERGGRSVAPMLVQLGRDLADRDVYVDLENMETLEIGGPEQAAEAIVTAVGATLASKSALNGAAFWGIGVKPDIFLGHGSVSISSDYNDALVSARSWLGSTVWEHEPPSQLRQSDGGDAWDPAVLVVGPDVARVQPAHTPGIAVVSAAPVHGPAHVLAPDGDTWMLRPLDIRLTPIGMYRADLSAVNELLESSGYVKDGELDDTTLDEEDRSMVGQMPAEAPEEEPVSDSVVEVNPPELDGDTSVTPAGLDREPRVLVRLMGPISVEVDGHPVEFARSKAEELVVWLATHRRRSTRTAAREALWHFDIKNAAFDNIVASARRSLDSVVSAMPGEEWIGRTTTELLPLHQQVRTDAELIDQALAWAMVRPVEERPAILAPAVQMLRGAPFDGAGFLWPDAEGAITELASLGTRAATELAIACLEVNDVAGALEATTRGLSVVPGHERLVALRMEALANTGDNTGVRVTWQEYEEVLCADADGPAEPSAELVELRNRLLQAS